MKCKNCGFKNPRSKQFCQNCIENLYEPINLAIITTPSWISQTRRLLSTSKSKADDIKAQEKEDAVREHELRVDPKARRWEESRKERLKKEKPGWVKRGRNVSDLKNI